MNRELVKEINELIDCDKKQNEFGGIIVVNRQFLIEVIALINELESENERQAKSKGVLLDNIQVLQNENQQLKDRKERQKLTFEQECSLIANGEDLPQEKQIEEMAKYIKNTWLVGEDCNKVVKETAEKYKIAMMLSIQEMQKYLEITEEQAKILYHHNNEIAKQFSIK